MNDIISTIEPYRITMLLAFILISVTLTFYSFYKKQQKVTYFEKYANAAIEVLENNIKEIDDWFKNTKGNPDFAYQEAKRVIFNKIALNFTSTDRKSLIDMSIGDFFHKILRFLRDDKPNSWNDINTIYENLKKQNINIISGFGENGLPMPTTQIYGKMYLLKGIMNDLVEVLRNCVEIVREEKEKDL